MPLRPPASLGSIQAITHRAGQPAGWAKTAADASLDVIVDAVTRPKPRKQVYRHGWNAGVIDRFRTTSAQINQTNPSTYSHTTDTQSTGLDSPTVEVTDPAWTEDEEDLALDLSRRPRPEAMASWVAAAEGVDPFKVRPIRSCFLFPAARGHSRLTHMRATP